MKIIDIKIIEREFISDLEKLIKEALVQGFEFKDTLQIRTYIEGNKEYASVTTKYTQVMVKYESQCGLG